jgi:hypothetical protein
VAAGGREVAERGKVVRQGKRQRNLLRKINLHGFRKNPSVFVSDCLSAEQKI